MSDLSCDEIPAREWHVEGIMPARIVTLFTANGGDGKSLLALQLSVATATGRCWLGRQCRRGSVLYMSCEDDQDEVHARLKDITRHEDVQLSDLGAIEVMPLVGQDAVLAIPDRSGKMVRTAFFVRVRQAIERVRPVMLVLDTLADVFGGDEIKKHQARQFMSMLRGLCVDFDMVILLIGHPSQSGMASGEGTSGNVAWSNSARSRWYLERVKSKDKDGRSEPDPSARKLTVMKNNYGLTGETMAMHWTNGVFVIDQRRAIASGPHTSADAEAVFLNLLREFGRQGRTVSDKQAASTFAPAAFFKEPEGQMIGRDALVKAMSRLLRTNRIVVVTKGSPSRERSHLAIAPSD